MGSASGLITCTYCWNRNPTVASYEFIQTTKSELNIDRTSINNIYHSDSRVLDLSSLDVIQIRKIVGEAERVEAEVSRARSIKFARAFEEWKGRRASSKRGH